MAAETMTTLDAILKFDYLPVIRRQFSEKIFFYQRIKRNTSNVVGKSVVFAVHGAWNEAVGAFSEGGTTPSPGVSTVLESRFPVRNLEGKFQITSKVIKATRTDRGAFVNALDWQMREVLDNLKKDFNRMLFNDGTGALARITAISGSNLTVDNSLSIRPNMSLEVWSARTGGTQRTGTATVTNVDYLNHVVTVNAVPTGTVVGDYLFRDRGRGIEVMGLLGIVDDGTYVDNFQGIARSSYSFWKANVLANGGVSRDLTLQLLQTAADRAAIIGGNAPTLWVSNYDQQNRYAQLVLADRLQPFGTMVLDGGWKAVEYAGTPWVADRDCPRGTIFGLNEEELRFFILSDFDWMDDDGAILHRTAAGTHAFEAILEAYLEFGTYKPSAHVVIRDLTIPSGY